jgi:hypothetical protein
MGFNVPKHHHLIVLKKQLRRHLLMGNLTENTILDHGALSFASNQADHVGIDRQAVKKPVWFNGWFVNPNQTCLKFQLQNVGCDGKKQLVSGLLLGRFIRCPRHFRKPAGRKPALFNWRKHEPDETSHYGAGLGTGVC